MTYTALTVVASVLTVLCLGVCCLAILRASWSVWGVGLAAGLVALALVTRADRLRHRERLLACVAQTDLGERTCQIILDNGDEP